MRQKHFQKRAAYQQVVKELKQAKDEMERMYNYFSIVTEPELIDASIYQINAIQKKYDYLVIKARQMER